MGLLTYQEGEKRTTPVKVNRFHLDVSSSGQDWATVKEAIFTGAIWEGFLVEVTLYLKTSL